MASGVVSYIFVSAAACAASPGVVRACCVCCIVCSASGRVYDHAMILQRVQRLRLLGSWVDPVQLCGLSLSGLVRYLRGRILSGCIASINPAYSVRLSSGSVRGAVCPGVVSICAVCSRISPGVLTVSGSEDPAGSAVSVRRCPVRCPVFRGFPDPAEVHPPPKTKKPTVPIPENKISQKTKPIEKLLIFPTGNFYLFNSQMVKIGAPRARVYGSCARYIVTSIPFR